MDEHAMGALMNELVEGQKKALLSCGRRLISHLTSDDILQPNDFPLLERDPHFRYEEGILAGMQAMQMALRSRQIDELTSRQIPSA